MSDNTKIEWADATLNYVNGCSVLSPGCTNCYAMKQAHRFEVRQGLTKKTNGGMVWTGEVRANDRALMQALAWKRGRKIFWNAHGDLFHESVPDEWIDRLFAVCALTPQHTHMILTKRSARMREYCADPRAPLRIARAIVDMMLADPNGMVRFLENNWPVITIGEIEDPDNITIAWPLPNVWAGVSVEDQTRADERIPDLLATPAAVRFISAEPLLGRVSPWTPSIGARATELIGGDEIPGLDWVIVGGESGPKARPMHPDWARSLRDQCQAAGVAFHFKQWGEWYPAFANDYAVDADSVRQTLEFLDGNITHRIGKKRAGRLLAGVEHNGVPA